MAAGSISIKENHQTGLNTERVPHNMQPSYILPPLRDTRERGGGVQPPRKGGGWSLRDEKRYLLPHTMFQATLS